MNESLNVFDNFDTINAAHVEKKRGQRATRVETPKGSLSEGLQQLTSQVALPPKKFGRKSKKQSEKDILKEYNTRLYCILSAVMPWIPK